MCNTNVLKLETIFVLDYNAVNNQANFFAPDSLVNYQSFDVF